MPLWLYVGFGGFIGAVLRYWFSGWLQSTVAVFPLGTLGVNFLGSFLLGLVLYLSEYAGLFTQEFRIFTAIGLLGSFTTMSTFGYESMKLLEDKEWVFFGLNLFATIGTALGAVYLSRVIVTAVWGE